MDTREIEFRPVVDERGMLVLFDIFIDGVWQGSRRTLTQCVEQVHHARLGASRHTQTKVHPSGASRACQRLSLTAADRRGK